MIWTLTTVQQWILFTSSVMVVGGATWRLVVAPGVRRDLPSTEAETLSAVEYRVGRLTFAFALLLAAGWALRMVVQVMAFRDPFVPLWDDISLLLFQTFWGTVWAVQGLVVLGLVGALAVAVRRGRTHHGAPPAGPGAAWTLVALLGVGLATTQAFSGHAMGVDSGRAFALAADALHVLTAGSWIGTLAVILLAGRGSAASGPAAFAAQIRRFSPVALVSGITLVAMGSYLSWTHLTAPADLWTTTWGRVLSAKVGLAAVIFALGFWNWRRGLPDMDTLGGVAALRRRAGVEVGFACAVILLTAILVHSTRP